MCPGVGAVAGVAHHTDFLPRLHALTLPRTRRLGQMSVKPVATIVASYADSPSRIEKPPRVFNGSSRDGPHRGARLSEDVVALVDPGLTPIATHEAHSRSEPVVTKVDYRVPPGPCNREDVGFWFGCHISTGGDLGARGPGPSEGQSNNGQRQEAL